jgi:hypothetical protein
MPFVAQSCAANCRKWYSLVVVLVVVVVVVIVVGD